MNARYENGWYYCWLIERRDLPQPEWFGADCFWHKNANDACWFARKEDAEQSAGECPHDVIVCEHGFDFSHDAHVASLLTAHAEEVGLAHDALQTYGRHLADCNYVVLGARPIVCTCGFEAALTPRGSQP